MKLFIFFLIVSASASELSEKFQSFQQLAVQLHGNEKFCIIVPFETKEDQVVNDVFLEIDVYQGQATFEMFYNGEQVSIKLPWNKQRISLPKFGDVYQGDYQLCFEGTQYFASSRVYFEVESNGLRLPKQPTGQLTAFAHQQADKISRSLESISSHLKSVSRDRTIGRFYIEEVFDHVNFYGKLFTGTILISTIAQIYTIRRMFQSSNCAILAPLPRPPPRHFY